MAVLSIAEYEELYEASVPYQGDATKQRNALKALLMLQKLKSTEMGGAGHSLKFAALEQEISLLQKMVASSARGSFSKARMLQT
jgi:hypothetical protein